MAKTKSTRDRLVEKATLEFARYGAKSVGVNQLCKAAEINKGSFYHYFESKQALIIACLEDEWSGLRDNLLAPAFAHGIPPLERIDTYFQIVRERQKAFHARYAVYPGCLMCTLGNELALEDGQIREMIKDYYRRNTAYLFAAYSDALDERSVKDDPGTLAEQVSLLIPAAFLQVRTLQDLKPLDVAQALARRFATEGP